MSADQRMLKCQIFRKTKSSVEVRCATRSCKEECKTKTNGIAGPSVRSDPTMTCVLGNEGVRSSSDNADRISALRYTTARVGGHGKRNVNRCKDRNSTRCENKDGSRKGRRINQNGNRQGSDVYLSIRTDRRVCGLKSVPKPSVSSSLRNSETPMSLSLKREICYRKRTNGTEGTGCGKKRTPPCNAADRRTCADPKGCRRTAGHCRMESIV